MHIGPQREAGKYAIETYSELRHNDNVLPSRFEVKNCAVVYADRSEVSHSVRIFVCDGT